MTTRADPGHGAALPRGPGWGDARGGSRGPRTDSHPGMFVTALSKRTPVSALGAFWTTCSASDYLGFQG